MTIRKPFDNPTFCALDTTHVDAAASLARQLGDTIGGVKIGMEFFYGCGVSGYQKLAATGQPIFLDLKLLDIPNTVAGAVRALLPLQPALLNVHASGGAAMMRAAADAAKSSDFTPPIMLACCVLTSLDDSDLKSIGITDKPRYQVSRLANLARENGMDGVVCSAHETAGLRAEMGPDFKLVVPGIRPTGSNSFDQKRVMSPPEAIEAGADVLVIGRPITASDNPAQSANAIHQSLRAA